MNGNPYYLSFEVDAQHMWNNLPLDVREARSLF